MCKNGRFLLSGSHMSATISLSAMPTSSIKIYIYIYTAVHSILGISTSILFLIVIFSHLHILTCNIMFIVINPQIPIKHSLYLFIWYMITFIIDYICLYSTMVQFAQGVYWLKPFVYFCPGCWVYCCSVANGIFPAAASICSISLNLSMPKSIRSSL